MSLNWEKWDGWESCKGVDCEIIIEKRPAHCDRGNWLARAFSTGLQCHIDEADFWPRYYFDRERADAEIEAWLRKRGLLLPETTKRTEGT